MECEVCGSRNVARREIEASLVEECNLCGNLQGDDKAVAHIEELRAGRERGLDDEVIPLVTALEGTGVFHILQASIRPPEILFGLNHNDAKYIERLLRSIELANRETKLRWLIELSLQHEIVYDLRPRFWRPPADITEDDIALARGDLTILGRRLRRDLSLSWWRD